MTLELTYLTLTMVLAASLWIPYIVGVTKNPQPGIDSFARPAPLAGYPEWVHRAHRAHLNLLEQALPFGVLVLIAHVLNVSTPVTLWAAAGFFWIRVIHAIGMISGITRFPIRPMIFNLGWLCTLAIAWQILTHG